MGYSRVRFIGFALPTTPADMVPVGDTNGPGAMAGTNRALEDDDADMRARLAVMGHAVRAAQETLAGADADGVLNVFIAPEFFWHGTRGPYVFRPDESDPADRILSLLEAEFPPASYPDFLFVFGTVITAQVGDIDQVMAGATTRVRNDIVRALGEGYNATAGPLSDVIFDMLVSFIKHGHAYPDVEVRNRALIVSGTPIDGVLAPLSATTATTEKYFDSNEDFLLWDVTGREVVTEQMTAYPVLDTSAGDLKSDARDPFAIFSLPGEGGPITVGVEICLDHSDHRMRKSVARSPWPAGRDGIDLHLVPSCGMQLHAGSVAARAGGLAFNCDGEYALGTVHEAGAPVVGEVSGVDGVFVDVRLGEGSPYAAHTQLARIAHAPVGVDEKAVGSHNATFATAPDVDVIVVPVPPSAESEATFAGGPGVLHIYGMSRPVAIRPQVS